MTFADCGLVVICYQPPPGLRERLRPVADAVARTVVVDNGPSSGHAALAASLEGLPRLQLMANGQNLGIAAALNQGLAALGQAGLRWGLTLDHDSSPAPDMLSRLRDTAQSSPERPAVCVPRIRYACPEIRCRWPVTLPGSRLLFRRVPADDMPGPTPVDLAIGSGMLVDLEVAKKLGGFREAMFIDLVDTEFCLRARASGYQVLAVPDAELAHRLGEVSRARFLGAIPAYPTHHAPVRHYYLARNRVHLWKLYGAQFPSWAAYEFLSGVKLITKTLCFETGRRAKIASTLRGTWQGLRTSPPPPAAS